MSRRASGGVLLACLALTLAGCGGTSTTARTPAAQKATPTPVAAPTGSPDQLDGAISRILAADQFVFVQQTTAAGDTKTVTVTSGRYSFPEKALETDAVLPGANDRPVEYLQRSVGGNGYLQEPSWGKPASGCWLRLPAAALAKQSGLSTAQLSGPPNAFALFKDLTGLAPAKATKGTGEVPIRTALSVFPGNIGAAAARSGLSGVVRVSLVLTKGIVEATVSGPKVAAALKAAGEPAVPGLANADMHVNIEDDTGGPRILAPVASRLMTLADLKAGRCPTG